MPSREDFGSWMSGGDVPTGETPGGRDSLGLPHSGPGSRARLGRRVVALAVDYAIATAIAVLIFRPRAEGYFEMISELPAWSQLLVFGAMNLILVGSIGSTIGHRFLGMQVRPLGDPGRDFVGFGRAAVRTVLLCLVIPAVVWDSDGRGLHDKAAGTVIVRR